jgi:uncharacterized phage-associated protein
MRQYSVIAVANAFIELARRDGKTLTNMKLQKLVYIAQGYSLAMLGEPLFLNNVHAFQWGPVIPKLYDVIKHYGSNPITNLIPVFGDPVIDIDDLSSPAVAIIRGVWQQYGNLTAAQLSTITHKQETPWSNTWSKSQYSVIPNDEIKNHYQDIIQKRSR